MTAMEFGQFGGDNAERPFVTLDGVDYPLVPESIVEGAPLNPFSPSNADGNTVAVVSQRHASEVWDDLTGGLGYRDDEPGSHQYALGNLDVRVPGAWVPPHKAGERGVGAAGALPYVAADLPVRGVYLSDDTNGFTAILTWCNSPARGSKVRRIIGNVVATVGITDTDQFRGYAEWDGKWWILTCSGAGGTSTLYRNAAGVTSAFSSWKVEALTDRYGLVAFDNKLICYNATAGRFEQWDTATTSWLPYVGNFVQTAPGSEFPVELFVWTDRSGSRDALYCLTQRRLLVYDEEGSQWEPLYSFLGLFAGALPYAHVNLRDSTLVVTVPPNLAIATQMSPATGTLLAFTPGTSDNLPINKGFAYPANSAYNSLGTVSPVDYPAHLASGIHWLYAFCYAPPGLGAGLQGGVYAFNEFGGWVQVYDPVPANAGSTALSVIGGVYGSNNLLVVLSDGSYAVQAEYDMHLNPPFGTYDSQAAGSTHDYYVRSGRVYNKQRNIQKLGSHVEVTFKSPIPTGAVAGKGTVYMKWRYFNENGLSAWQTSALFTTGAQRVSVDLNDGAGSNGIHYYYLEWELHAYMPTATATPPVVESVVLYYTYFQTNRYAYSFNIDLSAETWAEFYPDGTFHGASREYLQTRLLALMDQTNYHSFSYSQMWFTETVVRADCSLARRESSDDASGIYSMTVRDLEADQTPGSAGAGVFFPG